MLALDMVEINALVDRENMTGVLGAELIAAALGKKIL
jgi:arginase family enzyme